MISMSIFLIINLYLHRCKREIHNCLTAARALREDEARLDRESMELADKAERLEMEARRLDEEADRLDREAGSSKRW